MLDEKGPKEKVTVSWSSELIETIRFLKPTHRSRSEFSESMVWLGLQQWIMEQKRRKNITES